MVYKSAVTHENASMTDGYEWLDAERGGTEIYADAVHHRCICTWDLAKADNRIDLELPAMKLIARRKGCVIHGVKGSL